MNGTKEGLRGELWVRRRIKIKRIGGGEKEGMTNSVNSRRKAIDDTKQKKGLPHLSPLKTISICQSNLLISDILERWG